MTWRPGRGAGLAVGRLQRAPGRRTSRNGAVDLHGDRDHRSPRTELLSGGGWRACGVEERRVVRRLDDRRVETRRLARAEAIGDAERQRAATREHARGVAVDDRGDRDEVDELDGRNDMGVGQRCDAVTPGPGAREELHLTTAVVRRVDDHARTAHVPQILDGEPDVVRRAPQFPLGTERGAVP